MKNNLKPCPRCGDRVNLRIYRSIMHHLYPWFVRCEYCKFTAGKAHTKWGAKRKWNKATNILDVWEKVI